MISKFTRKGGEFVPRGTYWDSSTGEKTHFEKAGRLPGDETVEYLRFHPAALLLLGPMLGLAYVIFMPLIGILMVMWVAGGKFLGVLASGLRKVAIFNWEPGYAYLAGKKRSARNQAKSSEKSEKKVEATRAGSKDAGERK